MGMAAILLFMSGHGSCMCGHGCNLKEKCKALVYGKACSGGWTI